MSEHKWKFFRAGGIWQAKIETPEDVENLDKLDRKLWAALACPVKGMNFDEATLSKIDSDKDGTVSAGELLDAVKWTLALLKDKTSMFSGGDALKISNIDDSGIEGKILKSAAEQILIDIGKNGAEEIALSDLSDETAIFANTPFNADGIITELSCRSDDERKTLADIVKICGAKKDRSGRDGVDKESVSKFYADCREYAAWLKKGKELEADIASFEKFVAIEKRIDDFFVRCDIVAFQPDTLQILKASSMKIIGEIGENAEAQQLRSLPVARVNGEGILKLSEANPAYASEISAMMSEAEKSLKEGNCRELTKSEWGKIKEKMSPLRAWSAGKKDGVSALGEARVAEILAQNLEGEFTVLFESENEVGAEVSNIEKVERLARFNAKLVPLLRNFVNFSEFYSGKGNSAFQFGKLFIDRRECDFCMLVNNAGRHATMAPLSFTYLLYCDCKRAGLPNISIVAAVTAGDSKNLIVGRNGIFKDNFGRDWNATLVKIVENPIGIMQGFLSPYRRFVNWIGEQISKFATNAEKNAASISGTPSGTGAKKIDIGTVAALGVAVSGLTAAFGIIMESFFGLGIWMPLGVIGVVLGISLPSVVIAAMKLNNRNIGPLLDANGWTINTNARISIPFGGALTKVAKLPKGAQKSHFEFCGTHPSRARKIRRAIFALAILFAAGFAGVASAWYFGRINVPFVPDSPLVKKIKAENAKLAEQKAIKAAQKESITIQSAPAKSDANSVSTEKVATPKINADGSK